MRAMHCIRTIVCFVLLLFSGGVFSATVTLELHPVGVEPVETQAVSAFLIPPQADVFVHPSLPNSPRTVDINVYCSLFGVPIPDCDITNNEPVPAEPNTGGHMHGDGDRPLGTLMPMQGNTGSNAALTVTYTAPEASGVIRVSGTGYHPLYGPFSGSFTIGVWVPNLARLVPSPTNNFDLIGQTTSHPDNHWGTASLLGSLVRLANTYANNYPGSRLAYNDISLQYGGLFDIGAGWGTPHRSHRLGTDVDLRLVPVNRRQALRQLITSSGISMIIIEGNHWHLRQ